MFDNSPIEDDKNRKIQTFVFFFFEIFSGQKLEGSVRFGRTDPDPERFGRSLIHIAQFEQICKILFYINEFEEKERFQKSST